MNAIAVNVKMLVHGVFLRLVVFENLDKIILVMEYASGGELYDYINRKNGLSTSEARRFFRQIVSAVHYLHMVSSAHLLTVSENV